MLQKNSYCNFVRVPYIHFILEYHQIFCLYYSVWFGAEPTTCRLLSSSISEIGNGLQTPFWHEKWNLNLPERSVHPVHTIKKYADQLAAIEIPHSVSYSVVGRHRLTPIRIQVLISTLMPIQIDIKTMPILMRFLPQVFHVLENKKKKLFLLVTALPVYNV